MMGLGCYTGVACRQENSNISINIPDSSWTLLSKIETMKWFDIDAPEDDLVGETSGLLQGSSN